MRGTFGLLSTSTSGGRTRARPCRYSRAGPENDLSRRIIPAEVPLLAHTTVGEGPRPVVLLHGFLGSGRNLASLARRWASAAPVRPVVLDLTGHGSSPPLAPGAGLFELGRDVLEAARALSLPEPLTIVGHSLGGRVGLAAALVAPGAVREVTLLDIAPGPIEDPEIDSSRVVRALLAAPAHVRSRAEMRDALLAEGLSPAVVDWLGTNLAPEGDRYGWRFDRSALAELGPRVNAGDLWGAVERKAAVVNEIRGGRSRYVTDEDVRRLRALGSEVITLDGAGHFLHVDAPDDLLGALLRLHGSE